MQQNTVKAQRISVFGLGYVGSVTAACFAHVGNNVIGVDLSADKVRTLQSGKGPVLEAGLDELVAEGIGNGRLKAISNVEEAILASDISIVCVGTPSQKNGKLDLTAVERVCEQIGAAFKKKQSFHTLVIRSTVLPGTAETVVIPALERSSGTQHGTRFAVCSNPEFLREGSALSDFWNPSFTVIGAERPEHLTPLVELYAWAPGKLFETSLTVACMVKYVCNAFHALKVGFANEVGTLCKHFGADPESMTEIFLSDTRLNVSPAYLKPGFAFGGSCLPKDVRALTYTAKEADLALPLLESLLPSNDEHIQRAATMVLETGKKKLGVLGLSFKSGTDDLRESPMVRLLKQLLGEGCQMKVWDRHVSLGKLVGSNRQFIEDNIPHIGTFLTDDLASVIADAEVILIGTSEVTDADLRAMIKPGQQVIDLVNLSKAKRPMVAAAYAGICW